MNITQAAEAAQNISKFLKMVHISMQKKVSQGEKRTGHDQGELESQNTRTDSTMFIRANKEVQSEGTTGLVHGLVTIMRTILVHAHFDV